MPKWNNTEGKQKFQWTLVRKDHKNICKKGPKIIINIVDYMKNVLPLYELFW